MTTFECFATIGGQKHSLCLSDRPVGGVTFGDVYQHLSQRFGVSFDSHVFEIFDFEINSFNRLSSIEHPVNYLARIRVLPKTEPVSGVGHHLSANTSHSDSHSNNSNDSNNGSNDFDINPDYFNPNVVREDRINEDYFNDEFVGQSGRRPGFTRPPKSIREPKLSGAFNPYFAGHSRPTRDFNTNRSGDEYDEPYNEAEDDCYNRDFFTNCNDNAYGANDYYLNASRSHPKPLLPTPSATAQCYTRRSQLSDQPVAGPSRSPYAGDQSAAYGPTQQPYYRRPNTNSNFISNYNPNSYAMTTSPAPQPHTILDYSYGSNYRPSTTNYESNYVSNYDQPPQQSYDNYYQNRALNTDLVGRRPKRPIIDTIPYARPAETRPMSGSLATDIEGNNSSGFHGLSTLLSTLKEKRKFYKENGISVYNDNGIEKYYCDFCTLHLRSNTDPYDHTMTAKHVDNSCESRYEVTNRQFLMKMKGKSSQQVEIRQQELRKFTDFDKKRYIRHGLKLKDGTGPTAYICTRCVCSLPSAQAVHQHYQKFLEINAGINYPKGYYAVDETELDIPKVEIRYKRILTHLELKVDPNRTDSDTERLIELRDEGIVFKEFVADSEDKYFLCLICLSRFESSDTALEHSKSEDHAYQRSPDHYKGLNRALLADTDRSGQLEVQLSRKRELERLSHIVKESHLEHGIRMKNAIESEAYVCLTCDQTFGSLMDVNLHIDDYKQRLEASKIQELNEESLLDSAKRQIQLLANNSNDNNDNSGSETIDLTADELIDNLVDNIVVDTESEGRLADEGINIVGPAALYDINILYYDEFCGINITGKEQAIEHLTRPTHKLMKSSHFAKPLDKAFLIETNRMDELEVALTRMRVLDKLTDDLKTMATDAGIRLKDGIGAEAFWCTKCESAIDCPDIESARYIFENHINYNQKHIEISVKSENN